MQDYPNVTTNTWDKLKEVVLDRSITTDEHVYTFVHVCYARSLKNKNIRMAEVYKRAVRTAIETDRFNMS